MLHPAITWHGGAERQILTLALELQRLNHKVEIFTTAIDNTCYPEMVRQLTINVVQPSWINKKRDKPKKNIQDSFIRTLKGVHS